MQSLLEKELNINKKVHREKDSTKDKKIKGIPYDMPDGSIKVFLHKKPGRKPSTKINYHDKIDYDTVLGDVGAFNKEHGFVQESIP
jgi:hypothetical protein